jgi:hypothetical protein
MPSAYDRYELKLAKELEWGRDWMVAEIGNSEATAKRHYMLQCGRGNVHGTAAYHRNLCSFNVAAPD